MGGRAGEPSGWPRKAAVLLLGAALALATGGCIGTLYAVKASSASSKIETARTLGAEHYAPFEYYYAKEHLDKASEEAAAAQYGEAINFAEIAQDYADKAIALSRAAHQGAGR